MVDFYGFHVAKYTIHGCYGIDASQKMTDGLHQFCGRWFFPLWPLILSPKNVGSGHAASPWKFWVPRFHSRKTIPKKLTIREAELVGWSGYTTLKGMSNHVFGAFSYPKKTQKHFENIIKQKLHPQNWKKTLAAMPVWARNDSCLFRKQPCGQHAATQGSQFAVHLQDVVNVTPSWLVITCSPSAAFLLAIPPSHTVSPAVPFEGFPEKRQKAPAHETQWKRQGGSLEILQSLNPLTIPECYLVELGDHP